MAHEPACAAALMSAGSRVLATAMPAQGGSEQLFNEQNCTSPGPSTEISKLVWLVLDLTGAQNYSLPNSMIAFALLEAQLKSREADVNEQDSLGTTALHFAVVHPTGKAAEKKKLIKLMLAEGAKVSTK